MPSSARSRIADLPRRIVCVALLLSLTACVSYDEKGPLEIRVTERGYEMEGLSLATPQQVAEAIGKRGIRHVRLILDKAASVQQVERAVLALREAGAALGIHGDGQDGK